MLIPPPGRPARRAATAATASGRAASSPSRYFDNRWGFSANSSTICLNTAGIAARNFISTIVMGVSDTAPSSAA